MLMQVSIKTALRLSYERNTISSIYRFKNNMSRQRNTLLHPTVAVLLLGSPYESGWSSKYQGCPHHKKWLEPIKEIESDCENLLVDGNNCRTVACALRMAQLTYADMLCNAKSPILVLAQMQDPQGMPQGMGKIITQDIKPSTVYLTHAFYVLGNYHKRNKVLLMVNIPHLKVILPCHVVRLFVIFSLAAL